MTFLTEILPISKGWPGSRLSTDSCNDISEFISIPEQNSAIFFLLVAFIVLFLFYFRKISDGIIFSIDLFAGRNRMMATLNSQGSTGCLILSMLIFIPFYTFITVSSGASVKGYWITLMLISSLIVFRYIIFRMVGKLSGEMEGMRMVAKLSSGIYLLVMLASTPIAILVFAIPDIRREVVLTYLIILIVIGFIYFCLRAFEIIISFKFSHFFGILYLCALELLPICVIIKSCCI